jgi:hypothetical protein
MPNNTKTYWSDTKEVCLQHILEAWKEEGEIGQTVRHYYYKLLGKKSLQLTDHENSIKNAYNYVSRLLGEARFDGVLPWSAVIDPGRRNFTHFCHESLEDFVKGTYRHGFYADMWRGQPNKVEVWVEKDAMAEFMNTTCGDYRVPVYVNKGFASITVIEEAARRFGNGKGWTVLYCGDFDPSGLEIETVMLDKLAEHKSYPDIVRVALTQVDTKAPELAPAGLALKKGDSRTKKFIQKYGEDQQGFELDSMPATQLRQRLVATLNSYLDVEELNAVFDLETKLEAIVNDRIKKVMLNFHLDMIIHGVPGARLVKQEQMKYLLERDTEGA